MTILIIILIILAIPLVLSSFSPNQFTIEKSININKPKAEVFDYLKHLKNQEKYSKWVMTDPNSKMTYQGIDGTVGFVTAWDSENKQVGKGEQEIKSMIEGERIDCELRFIKPFENVSDTNFITESLSDNSTKVTWTFTGRLNYMMKIMHLLLNLKKALGKDIETSLNNLKTILEK